MRAQKTRLICAVFGILFILSSRALALETGPAERVLSFARWYKSQFERLKKIPIIKNDGVVAENPKTFYRVDFNAAERYLSELKKSGFVSPRVLRTLRQYFKKSDVYFLKNHQNDGPPDHLDVDLITFSNTGDELNNLAQWKVLSTSNSGNTAKVRIQRGSETDCLEYRLSKVKGTWLIDAYDYCAKRGIVFFDFSKKANW